MKLKTFAGGIHPPDNKAWTAHKPIENVPLPEELTIPLAQHIGAPAEAIVEVGDRVLRGQTVAKAKGFVSAPIHASSSGEVVAVEPRLHPSGKLLPSVVIKTDGLDEAVEGKGSSLDDFSADELRDAIRDAGIVGLGGATFPAHVKLSPPPDKKIDTLILNGVECEPYLTADHRLMLEQPDQLIDGVKVLMKVLGVDSAHIGIEANKPDAIELLTQRVAGTAICVVPLEVKYPQGAEKQLIDAVTGRQVPSGGLPMDVGAVVQNVGSAVAVANAILDGTALYERIMTVTGSAVAEPRNLRMRVGTPLQHLVDYCGGLIADPGKIIMGGPMMGMTLLSLDVPAIKGTSGLLILKPEDVPADPEGPCIRCGSCVRACPISLLPTSIATHSRLDMVDESESFGAMDCIECGSCTYVCPSQIPLVQAIRYGKAAIIAKRRKA